MRSMTPPPCLFISCDRVVTSGGIATVLLLVHIGSSIIILGPRGKSSRILVPRRSSSGRIVGHRGRSEEWRTLHTVELKNFCCTPFMTKKLKRKWDGRSAWRRSVNYETKRNFRTREWFVELEYSGIDCDLGETGNACCQLISPAPGQCRHYVMSTSEHHF